MRNPGNMREICSNRATARNGGRTVPPFIPSRLSFYPGAAAAGRQKRFFRPGTAAATRQNLFFTPDAAAAPRNDGRFSWTRRRQGGKSAFIARARRRRPQTTVVLPGHGGGWSAKALLLPGHGGGPPKRRSFCPKTVAVMSEILHSVDFAAQLLEQLKSPRFARA